MNSSKSSLPSLFLPPCNNPDENENSGDYADIVNGTMQNLVMKGIKLIPDDVDMEEACKDGRGNNNIHMPKAVKKADMEYLQEAQDGNLSEIPESGTPEMEEYRQRILEINAYTEAKISDQYRNSADKGEQQAMTNQACDTIFESHKKLLQEVAGFTTNEKPAPKNERTSTARPLKKVKN